MGFPLRTAVRTSISLRFISVAGSRPMGFPLRTAVRTSISLRFISVAGSRLMGFPLRTAVRTSISLRFISVAGSRPMPKGIDALESELSDASLPFGARLCAYAQKKA